MKLCPADINEKIQVIRLGFFGWGGRIRTYECSSQSAVSYRLTTPLWILRFLEIKNGVDNRIRTDGLQSHNLAL